MVHVIELNRFMMIRVSRRAGTVQVITRKGVVLPMSRRMALNALARAGITHRGLATLDRWNRTWEFLPAS